MFFKSKDPEKMRDWYREHLGFVTNEYGSLFEFRRADRPEEKGYLQWTPFKEDTNYFEPSKKEFMINYRVENLEALVGELEKSGVTLVDRIETFEYGIHIAFYFLLVGKRPYKVFIKFFGLCGKLAEINRS